MLTSTFPSQLAKEVFYKRFLLNIIMKIVIYLFSNESKKKWSNLRAKNKTKSLYSRVTQNLGNIYQNKKKIKVVHWVNHLVNESVNNYEFLKGEQKFKENIINNDKSKTRLRGIHIDFRK